MPGLTPPLKRIPYLVRRIARHPSTPVHLPRSIRLGPSVSIDPSKTGEVRPRGHTRPGRDRQEPAGSRPEPLSRASQDRYKIRECQSPDNRVTAPAVRSRSKSLSVQIADCADCGRAAIGSERPARRCAPTGTSSRAFALHRRHSLRVAASAMPGLGGAVGSDGSTLDVFSSRLIWMRPWKDAPADDRSVHPSEHRIERYR